MNYLKELINRQVNRPLIVGDEKKASYIQLIGFALIFTGVFYLFAKVVIPQSWFNLPFDGTRAAIVFFIIMLGCSLAFPDLLCDKRKELSTMRIVVFMMINVVCLLLIKTGWESKRLDEVGINGYWVSIIAFVFGGKAAQSYFEYKQPQANSTGTSATSSALSMDYDELLHMAIEQNKEGIKKINGYSDMYIGLSSNPKTPEKTCILINTSLNNRHDFPGTLKVKLASGEVYEVNTEVIPLNGVAKPHARSGNSICNQNTTAVTGTICCAVVTKNTPEETISYLTCSHVLSSGEPVNKGGYIVNEKDVILSPSLQYAPVGVWAYGKLTDHYDMGLVDTTGYQLPDASGMTEPVMYSTSLIGKKVYILGQLTQLEAYIIGKSIEAVPFEYNGTIVTLNGLVKLSRYPYQHEGVTSGGDSGALVKLFDNDTPFGMVVGSNERYTFVSPLTDLLNHLQATIY